MWYLRYHLFFPCLTTITNYWQDLTLLVPGCCPLTGQFFHPFSHQAISSLYLLSFVPSFSKLTAVRVLVIIWWLPKLFIQSRPLSLFLQICISTCSQDISSWTTQVHLKFKMSKTKVLIFPFSQQLLWNLKVLEDGTIITALLNLGLGVIICSSLFFILLQAKMFTKL